MPEVVIPDKYADQIPRFTLPKEFTNSAPELIPPVPAEAPKEEPKTVAEAPTTEPEKPEPEQPVEPEKVTTEKDPAKASQRRFERRIDRATRRAAEAQARADFLDRENAELKGKLTPAPTSGAPQVEDFADVQEYAKAYATFEKNNAIKEYQQKQATDAANAAQAELVQAWEAKANRGSSKYDDFEEMVGDLKPTTPWAIAIMQADNGDDIAHYLGSHPKETQRILALNPISQIREIGKLESKLSLTPEAPKTPSKAPPPITPVTGTATISDDEITPNMPFEKYLRLGNKMFRGR